MLPSTGVIGAGVGAAAMSNVAGARSHAAGDMRSGRSRDVQRCQHAVGSSHGSWSGFVSWRSGQRYSTTSL
jgi:hypothetical protein